MCGRFQLKFGKDENLGYRFDVNIEQKIIENNNIAPSAKTPIIIKENSNKLVMMNWGLKPIWAKDNKQIIINARAETLMEKPMFRKLIDSKRCIVPASGFYEWQKSGSKKVPFLIKPKEGELFGMAGLYENNLFTIITCKAATSMSDIHDRMPVILTKEVEHDWLNNDGDFEKYMIPYTKDLVITSNIEI